MGNMTRYEKPAYFFLVCAILKLEIFYDYDRRT